MSVHKPLTVSTMLQHAHIQAPGNAIHMVLAQITTPTSEAGVFL